MLHDRVLPPDDVLTGIAEIMEEAIAALQRVQQSCSEQSAQINRLLFVEIAETAHDRLLSATAKAYEDASHADRADILPPPRGEPL